MRRVVVLPQPDGPTRTTNSPSSMVRSSGGMTCKVPNDLVTCCKTTSAIPASQFRPPAGRVSDGRTGDAQSTDRPIDAR